jgi:hypothetical protein
MDDIKLYAATNNQLQELLRLTQTFLRDINSYSANVENMLSS